MASPQAKSRPQHSPACGPFRANRARRALDEQPLFRGFHFPKAGANFFHQHSACPLAFRGFGGPCEIAVHRDLAARQRLDSVEDRLLPGIVDCEFPQPREAALKAILGGRRSLPKRGVTGHRVSALRALVVQQIGEDGVHRFQNHVRVLDLSRVVVFFQDATIRNDGDDGHQQQHRAKREDQLDAKIHQRYV